MLRNIPWDSYTVQTAVLGLATAWCSYGAGEIPLAAAVAATFLGLTAIFQRRALADCSRCSCGALRSRDRTE